MDYSRFKEIVGNRFATVKFVKRTDGTLRTMNLKLGVKPPPGGEPRFDARMHGLAVVYDMQKQEYRSVPLDGITEIRANGKIYKIERR